VEVGLVVVVLGVVLDGVAGLFGVVAGLFGVVVVPVEVEPGVIVVPVALLPLVPVASVLEDCGTPVELAGTQFAELVLVEEEGIELLEELGGVLEVELGDVLEVELGDVLLVELGDVLLAVEELGVVVLDAVLPAALALVAGTMPAGQLFVPVALGVVVELGVVVVVDVPVCDEGIVLVPLCEEGIVLVPLCEDGVEVVLDGEVVVVEFVVVDVVCAATHVAPAVRINSNVNFFMVFRPRWSNRVALDCDAHIQGRVCCCQSKKWASVCRPRLVLCCVEPTFGLGAVAKLPGPVTPIPAA
jgi:hypothetical protein